MAVKPTASGTASKEFEEFLKSCPDIDDTPPEPLRIAGMVMRTKAADGFALMAPDGSRHDIPSAAVTGFTALSAGTENRMVELTLDRAQLSEELLGRLGGIKIPFEKSPPLDTIKEIGGGDTFKEGIFDTLKELGGGDTLKEQPFDTIKEIGGGDTLKETPWDTFKELGGGDTLKEIGGGEGTGINDTAIEGIGQPGGEVINPAMQARALNTSFGGGGGGGFPTLKEGPADTFKEIGGGDTLKELPGDGTRKEAPFDTLKEAGGADTLKEIGGGDTFKETGGGDTLKETGGADTLKELGGGDTLKETGGADTLKEQPFDTLKELGGGDTLKELGGGDTLKEGPFDTLKELNDDTVKESPFDTLKEASGGEGTGIADTLVEGIGQPGGEVVNPAVLAMQARSAAPGTQAFGGQPFGAQAAGTQQAFIGKPFTDKSIVQDKNFKEVIHDHTLKELVNDPKHVKEIVKEAFKEVAWEGPFGTGVGDSLAEGIFDPGSLVTNPGIFNQAAGGVPFVLATPHQASQGAVAQQMLAAQALAGRIGF